MAVHEHELRGGKDITNKEGISNGGGGSERTVRHVAGPGEEI